MQLSCNSLLLSTSPASHFISIAKNRSPALPCAYRPKKNTKGQNGLAYFLIQGPQTYKLLQGPHLRERKFQVTQEHHPLRAKLEKVHFNRISVPLTASSTRSVNFHSCYWPRSCNGKRQCRVNRRCVLEFLHGLLPK